MTALALAGGAVANAEKPNRLASNNPVAPRIPRRIASRREMGTPPKDAIKPAESDFGDRLLEARFIQ